jgi:2-polyprenyl-6-methoxyphenol hydroxylase-like FAD-dependent oxidoreductase
MSDDHPHVPIVIVGAGPVGLSLALGLARHGVQSVLVEKNAATRDKSKAPGIHVRTREIFRLWGVEQQFLQAAVLRESVEVHSVAAGKAVRERPLLALDFSLLSDEADRPGIMVLEQGKTEKLLLSAALDSGLCDVRFSTEAI